MNHRFQFRLSTLLWITLAVACWFGGMRLQNYREHRNDKDWSFTPHTRSPRPVHNVADEYNRDFEAARAALVQSSPPTE